MIAAPRLHYTVPLPSGRSLALGPRCLVMAVLNVTPDSFAERTPLAGVDAAVDAALRMEADGADLVDIGGESTRPGADPVPLDVELRRVLPVVERLSGRLTVPMSVDTSKAEVARAAVAAGAALVNDVRGLRDGAALGQAVARSGAALILMHSRGNPQTMGQEAVYGDLVTDIVRELEGAVQRAAAAGVAPERIVLDPGVGFAKRPSHSYGVLARLPELGEALDRPLLVGPSRKSFMAAALGNRPPAERDWGTAAAVTAAVLAGAHIVRVHAVAEMVQVVRVAEAIRAARLSDRRTDGLTD
jgi:dihydropteroate synthase